MNNLNKLRIRCLLAYMMAGALGSASLASAADSFTSDFPAGLACAFELLIEGSGGHQVFREFLDKNDNVVRTLTAGTGSALTFTNVATGATFSSQSNGAVTHVTYNPDGSSIWVTTGHNVLILFPTDTPAGPSTTLYVGHVVFTVDTSFNYALQQHSGQATDICAALSP
jgi:hypothetical protein